MAVEWQQLYQNGGDRMEMLQVADGYLLRNWVHAGSYGAMAYMGMVFIPGALPAPPVALDTPHVSPDPAAVGETLSCTMGNWDGVPFSYAYKWRRAGGEIVGTEPTYVATPTDSNKSIDCVVTATNAGGSTTAPPSNAVVIDAGRHA
jgi:hypothetical protein